MIARFRTTTSAALACVLAAMLNGCATRTGEPAPVVVTAPPAASPEIPRSPRSPAPAAATSPAAVPGAVEGVPLPAPVVPPVAPSPPLALPQPAPAREPTVAEGRERVSALLPAGIADRAGWATDIYAAFASMQIPLTPENICAVAAVTEQESSFRADPRVPGLSKLAWQEIERRRQRAGIPKVVLWGALALPSPTGKSYSARLDAVKSERELSDIFEDFIGMVPIAKPFLENRNPVRTGGPMQVSIAFAEAQAAARPYPYPVREGIRHEVFTRRGGMYFGIAHLLDYPVSYPAPLYRFADFNAGRYSSRNAAFQNAVTQLTGIPLALDGDLLRYDGEVPLTAPGNTEHAVRVLAKRLKMGYSDIRHDLELSRTGEFERSRLYFRLFVLADGAAHRPLPRAMLPRIQLKSPKITHKLTTDWFARRVEGRYRSCLARAS